jgi:hypothetical protein
MNGDLISRSALLEKAFLLPGAFSSMVSSWDIAHAPAVDAVRVIHCKDCFYWMKAKVNRAGGLVCPKSGMEIVATDYCSRADKRKCHYDR